jgi:hypothetical protein
MSELETLLNKAGFTDLAYRQTLFPTTDLSVREGYDHGGFVVIQAHKAG